MAEGKRVLQEVVQLTGLPEEYLDQEITSFLGTPGGSVNNMTLEQLRCVMLSYLEVIHAEMTASNESEENILLNQLDANETEMGELRTSEAPSPACVTH